MTMVIDPKTGKYKQVRLSAAAESLNLMRHGTNACELSAAAILQTAKASLEAYRHNQAREQYAVHERPAVRPMAFLPKHCRGANAVSEVLRNAIKDRPAGLKSSKRNTALVYADKAKLEAALAMATQ